MNCFHRKHAVYFSRNLLNPGHIHTFNMPGQTSGLSSPYQTRELKINIINCRQFSRQIPSACWRQSYRFLSMVTLKSLIYSASLEHEETSAAIFDSLQIARSCPRTSETVRHCMVTCCRCVHCFSCRIFWDLFWIMTWSIIGTKQLSSLERIM
jgi:hypothetical protein